MEHFYPKLLSHRACSPIYWIFIQCLQPCKKKKRRLSRYKVGDPNRYYIALCKDLVVGLSSQYCMQAGFSVGLDMGPICTLLKTKKLYWYLSTIGNAKPPIPFLIIACLLALKLLVKITSYKFQWGSVLSLGFHFVLVQKHGERSPWHLKKKNWSLRAN